MNIYQENGYKDRQDYLQNLANYYGCDIEILTILAETLGVEEDFDGLVIALEDHDWAYK
jgi:hypothetical protein